MRKRSADWSLSRAADRRRRGQWAGTIEPNQTQLWYTWGWPAPWHVVWYLMSTSPHPGAPQLDWDVAVERANGAQCTYWITVKNLTASSVNFEGRFAVLS